MYGNIPTCWSDCQLYSACSHKIVFFNIHTTFMETGHTNTTTLWQCATFHIISAHTIGGPCFSVQTHWLLINLSRNHQPRRIHLHCKILDIFGGKMNSFLLSDQSHKRRDFCNIFEQAWSFQKWRNYSVSLVRVIKKVALQPFCQQTCKLDRTGLLAKI